MTSTIAEKFGALVGPGSIRASAPADVVCGVPTQFVVEPREERQLAAVLSLANELGLVVIPRGGGTKLDWGNSPMRADIILSTARLNRILEHAWADLTVTVEAGCTLQSLQEMLARHGQRLAFDGLWPERATIGGALSTNDSGALRLRFGALRDLIIGVTLALSDGTLASSGGKVVKNVAGYDLPKLVTGAFGTLGVITRAVFRLHPLPWRARTLSFATQNLQEMQTNILSIQESNLAHTALQVQCADSGLAHADILFEATDAGLNAQELQLRKLLGSTSVDRSSEAVWSARQELWTSGSQKAVIAKISVLPAEMEKTIATLTEIASAEALNWEIVLQATGIGLQRFDGTPGAMSAGVAQLRKELQGRGGSLVVLRGSKEHGSPDVWGDGGDALPLMRAVKCQLDSKSTLNPGRFVGGI